MTPEDLSKSLDDNRADVMAAAKTAILNKITQSVQWSLPDVMHKQVHDFMTAEIAPEVAKQLADQKGAIMEATAKAASEIGDALAKAMVKQAAESMVGYKGREIFKSLFGY